MTRSSTIAVLAGQSPPKAESTSVWRSVGLWLAVLLALSQLVNAARAMLNPVGFSDYMGLPLSNAADTGFLFVYAFRAVFLGLFALIIVARRDLVTLKWFALVASIMPLGDMALTAWVGAPTAIVGRHAAYVVYVLVVFFLLHRFTTRIRRV